MISRANVVEVRRARPEDAEAIVSLIRAGFPAKVVELLTYGCNGAAEFVRRQIGVMGRGGDAVHVVACRGARVVGCIESDWTPRTQFFNWLAIDPEHREGGVARRLLRTVTEDARRPGQAEVAVDVFVENEVAARWYERLQFRHQHRTGWWLLPWPSPPRPGGPIGSIRGFAHAACAHERLGFSTFNVVTEAGEHAVGLLGEKWFRITSPDALRDATLLDTLQVLDPGRSLFALLRDGQLPEGVAGGTLVATTTHMTIGVSELVANLETR